MVMGWVSLGFSRVLVVDMELPLMVLFEIVTFRLCVTREDAFFVTLIACLLLSDADVELASWALKLAETEPVTNPQPPDALEVTLN
jgi:hypothetical protein